MADRVDVLKLWKKWNHLPFGKILFSKIIGFIIPYTGSIRPEVLDLDVGFARIQMRDRRSLRNHLRSLHAVALTNLGELTSGMAFTAGLPSNKEAIVTSLSTEFFKKARGNIIAESKLESSGSYDSPKVRTQAILRNSSNETVAIVSAEWTLRDRMNTNHV